MYAYIYIYIYIHNSNRSIKPASQPAPRPGKCRDSPYSTFGGKMLQHILLIIVFFSFSFFTLGKMLQHVATCIASAAKRAR